MSSTASLSTILVVDDNPENLTVLSGVLRPEYRVRVATEGFKAISIVESSDPPDLVLLDVMMPGMSGFEVCAKLKANADRRDIPIIFVTALGELEDEQHGLELGAIDYITKPISPSIVLARVRNHLELKHARESLAKQNAILEEKVAERTADLVRANRELKESYFETIDLAYAVLSEADDYLGNHSKRVATYSLGIAAQLGLNEETTFDIHVAALLHDLGLIGVGASEIKRMMRLTSVSPNREAMYWNHPIVQMRVLSTSARFSQTATIIASHHEALDGSGFPAGVNGDAIPLGSRVLAVADHWDGFAQGEPAIHNLDTAFERFSKRNEGKLDPEVLAAFFAFLRQGDPFSKVVDHDTSELTPGMVVVKTIRTKSGAILLRAGTALRQDHIADLARYAAAGDILLPIQVYRDTE
jgi:putative two-component system response regulator